MADPVKPDIEYSYTGFQQATQDRPFPGTQLDADLAELKRASDDTIDALSDVRRADGKLNNKIVTTDSLADGVLVGIEPPEAWATGTEYFPPATVTNGLGMYRCVEPHTSGVFADDLAAGKWELIFTLQQGPAGADGADGADGQDGAPGADGAAATVGVGTVTTGAAGSDAAVTNSGTSAAAVFDFTIPKGAKGDTGATGPAGADGAPGTTDYNELDNKPTLGTAAAKNTEFFATAAQGTKADGAAQKANNLADLASANTALANLGAGFRGTQLFKAADTPTLTAILVGAIDDAAVKSGTTLYNRITYMHSVRDFGAKGDGTTDDTTALQDALDSNRVCFMPPGKYRITSPLLVDPQRNRGNGFIGLGNPSFWPYTTQTGGPAWTTGVNEPIIYYDGNANDGAVIAVSGAAVGTEPGNTFASDTIVGFRLESVLLDGNNKALFGLYTARLQNGYLDHVLAMNCKRDGIYINGSYSGHFNRLTGYRNGRRGVSFGAALRDMAWTTQYACNAIHPTSIWGFGNGTGGEFDDATSVWSRTAGCGIYWGPHRGCTLNGWLGEANDGAGLVYAADDSGNGAYGGYTEQNCSTNVTGSGSAISTGRADQQYGIMVIGPASNTFFGNTIKKAWVNAEYIYIGGTNPSARARDAFTLDEIDGATGIKAANGFYYYMLNCHEDLADNITGQHPLNDGSWTPVLKGSTTAGSNTYAVQSGEYVYEDGWVTAWFRLSLSATSGMAGGLIIDGLPFPCAQFQSSMLYPCEIGEWILATSKRPTGYVLNGNSYITLMTDAYSGSSGVALAASDISNSTRLTGVIRYRA